MREVVIVVVIVIVLFVLGFLWPRRSRTAQQKIKDVSAQTEEKVRGRGGKVGDWTAASVEATRWVSEKSAHAGRKAHDKVFDSDEGSRQERELQQDYGQGGEQGEGPADPYPHDDDPEQPGRPRSG